MSKGWVDLRFHIDIEPEYVGEEPTPRLVSVERLDFGGVTPGQLNGVAEDIAQTDRLQVFMANSVGHVLTSGGTATV